jgi:phage repressor protein C with HTH and peptisase S24 domain
MSSNSSGAAREVMLHTWKVENFSERLSWALKRAGKNASDLARALDISRNAVSQWKNAKNGPSQDSLSRAAKFLRVNVHWLSTGEGQAELAGLVGSFDPDSDERRGVSSTGKGRHKLTPGSIAELEMRAGMGGGGFAAIAEVNDDGAVNSYAADRVKAEWIMPPDFVRNEMHVSFGHSEIITAEGDSMEPDIRSGDRLVVDRLKRSVNQGGIFAVRDGDELIIKQVELVRPVTDPPRITCTSRNPAYSPFELTLDGSAEVIGRIAGKISRM